MTDNHNTNAEELIDAQREAEILRLAIKTGYSTRKIAAALPPELACCHEKVRQIINKARAEADEANKATREELRALQHARYEDIITALYDKATNEIDPDPAAADRLMRAMLQQAKLHGLDAPAKSEITIESVEKLLSAMPEEAAAEVVALLQEVDNGDQV